MNKSKVRKLKWILDKIRGCNFHFSLFFFPFFASCFFAFKDVSLLFSTSLHISIFFCLSSFYCSTTSSNPVQLSLVLSLSLSLLQSCPKDKGSWRSAFNVQSRVVCSSIIDDMQPRWVRLTSFYLLIDFISLMRKLVFVFQ